MPHSKCNNEHKHKHLLNSKARIAIMCALFEEFTNGHYFIMCALFDIVAIKYTTHFLDFLRIHNE